MMAVTPSRVPRRAAASLPLMPLSLQHHFDRRIVGRPEAARRLVRAVPTHLQNPIRRNRLQEIRITGVVSVQPDPNADALQPVARRPRNPGELSMWTRSYAVAPLKLARSISSVVRMFDLRCAYNGTPTTRVANPSASNPWRSIDMCPPSNV